MSARINELVVLGLILVLGMSHSLALAQSTKTKRLELDEQKSTTIYQHPEEFAVGRWGEFQRLAKELWTTEPNHPYAARAMFDWLLVAQMRPTPPMELDRVQIDLLTQHTSSIYARYLMVGHNPQELRTRLSLWFELQPELNESILTQFGRVALLGFSAHGPAWLTIDDYGIQSLLAARVANLAGLTSLLEAKFAAAPEATQKILEAGLNSSQSSADRYVRLSEFGETKSARFIQRALWTQLTEEEQQAPQVQAALAESLLRDGRLDLVAPIAERLVQTEPNNPRWLLWSGCCLIATDDEITGHKRLKTLAALEADSVERSIAKQLLPLLETLSQSEEDSAQELQVASQQIAKSAPQTLTFESSFASKDGAPCRSQIQFNGPQFAVVTWKAGKPRAGFQCSPGLCRFFTKDEAVTYEMAERQTQPTISFQLKETGSILGWHINTSLVAEPIHLMPVLRKFFESPALENGGWHGLLKRRRAGGAFAIPVAESNGQKRLRWRNVDLLKSKLFEYGCLISETGELTQIQLGETQIKEIQYGQLDGIKLPKLNWPDFPAQRIPPTDFNGMMRIMTVMTQLYSFDDSTNFTAPVGPPAQK